MFRAKLLKMSSPVYYGGDVSRARRLLVSLPFLEPLEGEPNKFKFTAYPYPNNYVILVPHSSQTGQSKATYQLQALTKDKRLDPNRDQYLEAVQIILRDSGFEVLDETPSS